MRLFSLVLIKILLLFSCHSLAFERPGKGEVEDENRDRLHIASASNFRDALQEIIALYQQQNPTIQIVLSTGSSGSLYQQSLHGAPFDIFLSADDQYPHKLGTALGLKEPPKTYAVGELVFWQADPSNDNLNTDLTSALQKSNKVAIANPKIAPYGKAAQSVLNKLSLKPAIIKGNSIGQVFQFIKTGNISAGFIARSQTLKITERNQLISIPQQLYTPLEQQGVLISQTAAANKFYQFLWKPESQKIIQQYGYQLPAISIAAYSDSLEPYKSANVPTNTSLTSNQLHKNKTPSD